MFVDEVWVWCRCSLALSVCIRSKLLCRSRALLFSSYPVMVWCIYEYCTSYTPYREANSKDRRQSGVGGNPWVVDEKGRPSRNGRAVSSKQNVSVG